MMTETVVTIDPNRNPNPGPQPKPAGNGLGWLKFNIEYFTSVPGIVKLMQLIFGIICMACASPAFIPATHYFLFVAVVAFIATLLWAFVYLLGIREVLNLAISWILTELINTGIITVLYFIAFVVQLSSWSHYFGYGKGSNVAAGVFGLFNTLVYGFGTYLLIVEHRSSSPN